MTTCTDCEAKDELIGKLSSHLAAASEVLGQLARKDGPAAEIVRLSAALARIATGCGDPIVIAEIALRWKEAL